MSHNNAVIKLLHFASEESKLFQKKVYVFNDKQLTSPVQDKIFPLSGLNYQQNSHLNKRTMAILDNQVLHSSQEL